MLRAHLFAAVLAGLLATPLSALAQSPTVAILYFGPAEHDEAVRAGLSAGLVGTGWTVLPGETVRAARSFVLADVTEPDAAQLRTLGIQLQAQRVLAVFIRESEPPESRSVMLWAVDATSEARQFGMATDDVAAIATTLAGRLPALGATPVAEPAPVATPAPVPAPVVAQSQAAAPTQFAPPARVSATAATHESSGGGPIVGMIIAGAVIFPVIWVAGGIATGIACATSTMMPCYPETTDLVWIPVVGGIVSAAHEAPNTPPPWSTINYVLGAGSALLQATGLLILSLGILIRRAPAPVIMGVVPAPGGAMAMLSVEL